MKLVFTKNTSPLSKLIRFGLGEPVSHFGIVFDNGIIFHSNLMGAHVEWYKSFTKKNSTVEFLDYALPLEKEESIYLSILNTNDGAGYDFKALIYFGYRILLFRLFKIAIPKTNEYQDASKFLCTELAKALPPYILPDSIRSKDLSIVSPYKLYLDLKGLTA